MCIQYYIQLVRGGSFIVVLHQGTRKSVNSNLSGILKSLLILEAKQGWTWLIVGHFHGGTFQSPPKFSALGQVRKVICHKTEVCESGSDSL